MMLRVTDIRHQQSPVRRIINTEHISVISKVNGAYPTDPGYWIINMLGFGAVHVSQNDYQVVCNRCGVMPTDPVFYKEDTKGWYAWDSSWSSQYGPFSTEAEAQRMVELENQPYQDKPLDLNDEIPF